MAVPLPLNAAHLDNRPCRAAGQRPRPATCERRSIEIVSSLRGYSRRPQPRPQ